jgi:DUF1009 family protein
MTSRFLPPDFDPSGIITVIAGRGTYPVLTVAALRSAEIPVRLIGVHDETKVELVESFPETERKLIHAGQLGGMLKALKTFDSRYTIMAGQITPKRLFHGLRPDLKAAAILMKLKRRNAETIFGAIADEIAAIGIQQLDARCFLDEHLASEGWMTRQSEKVDESYLNHGIEIARECARLDIGQGCVVRKGTVVAVEAFEGTDAMLTRAGTFKTDQLIFVKSVKPAQDFRFDVPVFGLRTIQIMKEAAITTAVLETGNTLILEKPEVIRQAEAAGIQLFGFTA